MKRDAKGRASSALAANTILMVAVVIGAAALLQWQVALFEDGHISAPKQQAARQAGSSRQPRTKKGATTSVSSECNVRKVDVAQHSADTSLIRSILAGNEPVLLLNALNITTLASFLDAHGHIVVDVTHAGPHRFAGETPMAEDDHRYILGGLRDEVRLASLSLSAFSDAMQRNPLMCSRPSSVAGGCFRCYAVSGMRQAHWPTRCCLSRPKLALATPMHPRRTARGACIWY